MELILALKSTLRNRGDGDSPDSPVLFESHQDFEFNWSLDCFPIVIIKDSSNISVELMKELEGING